MKPQWTRRRFMVSTGSATAAALLASPSAQAMESAHAVGLLVSPADTIAKAGPVLLAVAKLKSVLEAQSIAVKQLSDLSSARGVELIVVICSSQLPEASRLIKEAGADVPTRPEALLLLPHTAQQQHLLSTLR